MRESEEGERAGERKERGKEGEGEGERAGDTGDSKQPPTGAATCMVFALWKLTKQPTAAPLHCFPRYGYPAYTPSRAYSLSQGPSEHVPEF